ncbi:hypothetical protein BU23DRAFT_574384 [Bimuria novae-zelandiae CBS 107.79]|uniref:Uncharacterized protein n=1 Tax=Bimuria novae-zelandiae CBS 107.79 TaxID=1447943 RepID=A0A6A5UPZ9_9PLEO|nr:hypothetical protein BU23DRAFT_574384 [Bimuria novae-zelandiae CBS 107.79]
MDDVELLHGVGNMGPSKQYTLAKNAQGYSLYSITALLAPYRTRNDIDLSKLRGYFAAFLDEATDHIWSMREDPSYTSSVIAEELLHQPELVRDSARNVRSDVGKKSYKVKIFRDTIAQAYFMVGIWDRLTNLVDTLRNPLEATFHGNLKTSSGRQRFIAPGGMDPFLPDN